MIRVTGRYELLTDNFEVIDRVTDVVMDSLMAQESVIEPDVGVSLSDRLLEIWLVVATDDPLEAVAQALAAISLAFAASGLTQPSETRAFVHPDLLGSATQVSTELVPV